MPNFMVIGRSAGAVCRSRQGCGRSLGCCDAGSPRRTVDCHRRPRRGLCARSARRCRSERGCSVRRLVPTGDLDMTIVCGIEMPNDLMSPRYSKGISHFARSARRSKQGTTTSSLHLARLQGLTMAVCRRPPYGLSALNVSRRGRFSRANGSRRSRPRCCRSRSRW
jgi:hypothetical protein